MQRYREHAKLVDALGGAAKIARTIGDEAVNVRQWKRQGVPWRWRHLVANLASARGITVPRDFLKPPRRVRK